MRHFAIFANGTVGQEYPITLIESKLSDGTSTLYAKIQTMLSTAQEEIDKMMIEYMRERGRSWHYLQQTLIRKLIILQPWS